MKPHPLDSLLPEICQLIDACRMDWQQQGCWSEWDQSVRDRITAYNLARLASPPVEAVVPPSWIRTQHRYPTDEDIARGIVVAWQREGEWRFLQTHGRHCGMPMGLWWACANGSAPEMWTHADKLVRAAPPTSGDAAAELPRASQVDESPKSPVDETAETHCADGGILEGWNRTTSGAGRGAAMVSTSYAAMRAAEEARKTLAKRLHERASQQLNLHRGWDPGGVARLLREAADAIDYLHGQIAQLRQDARDEQREAQREVRDAVAEARWQAREGEDRGY